MARHNKFPIIPRILAPAGGFSSPSSILKAAARLKQTANALEKPDIARFSEILAQRTGARHAVCFGSGKESLWSVFRALRASGERRPIAMSAYTCPDIAVAAAEAEFQVLALDIDDRTLAVDLPALSEALSGAGAGAIVFSNLFGLPDDIGPCSARQQVYGTLVIDDACQAFMSSSGGYRIGLRPGTLGIISFGRGKAICGAGGGAVLFADDNPLRRLSMEALSTEPGRTLPWGWKHLLLGVLSWGLERPRLYGIPSHLPFLGLGKTEAKFGFRREPPTYAQMLHACVQLAALEERGRIHAANARSWAEALIGLDLLQPALERGLELSSQLAPIRYPVLFRSSAQRDRAHALLAEKGLGVSVSYPRALPDYPELKETILPCQAPKARSVAERILTLPTHIFVSPDDVAQGADLLKKILG